MSPCADGIVVPVMVVWRAQVNRRIDYKRLTGQLEALARRTSALETSLVEEHELSVTTLNAILQRTRRSRRQAPTTATPVTGGATPTANGSGAALGRGRGYSRGAR